jgi:hypothetical protein
LLTGEQRGIILMPDSIETVPAPELPPLEIEAEEDLKMIESLLALDPFEMEQPNLVINPASELPAVDVILDNNPEEQDYTQAQEFISQEDATKQAVNNSNSARAIIAGEGDPNKKVEAARGILNQDIVPKTTGEVISEKEFGGDKISTKELDLSITGNVDKITTMQILGGDPEVESPDQFFSKKVEGMDLLIEDLYGNIREVKEIIPGKFTTFYRDTEGKLIHKGDSFKDLTNLLTLEPTDPTVEVDVFNFFKLVFDGQWDKAGEQFAEQSRQRHGEDWVRKYAIFTIKEMGVDAALLSIAVLRFGKDAIFAAKGSALTNQLKFAVRRTLIYAFGGTAVQKALGEAGGTDIDLSDEFMGRFIGGAIGEGAGPLLMHGGKGLVRKIRLSIGKILNRKQPDIDTETIVKNTSTEKESEFDLADRPLAEGSVPSALKVMMAASGRTGNDIPTMKVIRKAIKMIREKQPVDKIKEVTGLSTFDLTFVTSQFVKAVDSGKAVGFKFMGELTERQKAVQDSFIITMGQQADFEFRTNPFNAPGLKSLNRFGRSIETLKNLVWWTEDQLLLGAAAKDVTDIARQKALYNKTFTKAIKIARTNLSKKEDNLVFELLHQGDLEQKLFTVDELQRIDGVTPAVIDSYAAIRSTLDIAGAVFDAGLVKKLKGAGWKQHGDNLVRIIKEEEAGLVQVASIDRSTGLTDIITIPKSTITDVKSYLSFYGAGYVPKTRPTLRFKLVKTTPDGTVTTEGGYTSAVVAQRQLNKRQGDLAEGEVLSIQRLDDHRGTTTLSTSNSGIKAIEQVQMSNLEKAINDIPNLSPDEKEILKESFSIMKGIPTTLEAGVGPKLPGRARKRTNAELPGNVKVAPTDESIQQYMRSVANFSGDSDFRGWAIREFKKKYIGEGRLPIDDWDSPIDSNMVNAYANVDGGNLAKEAKRAQSFLRQNILNTTRPERFVTTGIRYLGNQALRYERAHPFLRALEVSKYLGLDTAEGFNNTVKKAVSIPNLVILRPSMFFIQGSQTAVTVGTRLNTPGILKDSFNDIMLATSARVHEMKGVRASREATEALDALRRSGFVADLAGSDYGDTFINQEGMWNKFMNTAGTPLTAGEATNRVTAFYVARREYIELAKKGELIGINGKPFKGVADDTEFLRLVAERAEITSLNLSKAASLRGLRGFSGTLLQFWQILPKYMNTFTSNQLTGTQKTVGAIALFSLWGPDALPLVGDGFFAADWLLSSDDKPSKRQQATGFAIHTREWLLESLPFDESLTDKERDVLRTFLSRGGVAAIGTMLDTDIDLVHRFTIGAFLREYSNMAKMGNYIAALQIVDNARKAKASFLDFLNLLSNKEGGEMYADPNLITDEELLFAGIKPVGNIFPVVGDALTIWLNSRPDKVDPAGASLYDTPMWRYLSGSTLEGVEPTIGLRIIKGLGFTAGDLHANQRKVGDSFLWIEAYQKMIEKFEEAWTPANSRNHEHIERMYSKEVVDLVDVIRHLGIEKNVNTLITGKSKRPKTLITHFMGELERVKRKGQNKILPE